MANKSSVRSDFKTAKEASLENWRTPPFCKWAFHHVREIIPSAEIANDPKKVWNLNYKSTSFETEKLMSLIKKTSTDAVVIVHENHIIFETYHNGMDANDQHILFSVSKSILGLLAGCLIKDSIIKETDLIGKYLPEMISTAYNNASIRDALDMRIGVQFNEDYTAQHGPMIDYRYASNWNPTPDSKMSLTIKSFLASLKESDGLHGRSFHYVSPNTDLLAWVFECASGLRYNELISNYIFKPIGSESSAYITLDRMGGMRAAGGICMTARDLARVGTLIYQRNKKNQEQIIPSDWIADFFKPMKPDIWNKGTFKDFFTDKNMHYRSNWYIDNKFGQLIFGFGIHGQYLFVDPHKKISIAWLSSQAQPLDKEATNLILNMVNGIRNSLN